MACPLFLPLEPLGDFEDAYSGECASAPGLKITVEILRRCCNRGYARGVCERAAQTDVDAFRFLVKAADGGNVDVAWSIERDHHPVAVGTLRVTELTALSNQPLDRQARVCATTLLRP